MRKVDLTAQVLMFDVKYSVSKKSIVMISKISNTIFLISILFVFFSCKKNIPPVVSVDPYFSAVSENWTKYMYSSNNGWLDNDQGRFSWDDGYALEGLVSNFERSNDIRYVDTFLKASDRIFAGCDLARGIKDVYRNMSTLHGWSATRYTANFSPHIFGVTDAMILFPVVRMYNIAKRIIPDTDSRLAKIRQGVDFAVTEFLEVQKSDWINISSEMGYFHDPYFKSIGINTPVNQFARVGSFAIELYLATGNPMYLSYAEKMAKYLQGRLITKDDYFYWSYMFALNPSQTEAPDDLSHSNLVVQFMILCYNNSIVFSGDDMRKLVNLYLKQLLLPGVGYREYLDGPVPSSDVYIAHYYPLSAFDSQVRVSLHQWYNNQMFIYDPSTFLNHFGNKLVLLQAMDLYYK